MAKQIFNRKDSRGPFYQFGHHAKYHYKPGSESSRNSAKAKARTQQKAAYANGYTGKRKTK